MKKFLSLVLALVMTFSLVTVSAGATEYTDNSSIKYGEAVDVISGLKIVDGYANGAFNPSNTLTRGAAAKIICNMVLGPTAAAALSCTSAPFSDVPANHTFAGYIEYCSSQGIINGYGDGTFKPAATVTGYQFLKMLLGALGYDATIEKFTGSNYTVNVAKLAVSLKLTKGNSGFVGSKALTREEACLYAFNTLKATMVDYATKGTNITVNGVTINQGASKAEKVPASDDDGYKTKGNDAYLQFCEKYFDDLTYVSSAIDDYGRPAHKWYNGKVADKNLIGTYADEAILSYTDAVKGTDLKDDIKDAGYELPETTVDVVRNGGDVNKYAVSSLTSEKIGGKGTLIEVFADDDDVVNKVVVVATYLGEVTSIAKDKASTKSVDERALTVKYTDANGNEVTVKANAEDDVIGFESVYANVKKNDKILVVPKADNTKSEKVVYVAIPETVTGSVTRTSTSSVTIGGTAYDLAGVVTKNPEFKPFALTSKTATVYLDEYGYAIGYDGPASTGDKSVAVLKAYKTLNADGELTDMIKGVTSNGETVTWEVASDKYDEDTIYTYTEKDDVYTLAPVGTTEADEDDVKDEATLYVGDITLGTSAKSIAIGTKKAYFASDVKFIFVDDGKATVKDGVQKVADDAKGVWVTIDVDGSTAYISAVYVLGTTSSSSTTTDDVIYVAAGSTGTVNVTVNGKDKTYYSYDAYINGELVDDYYTSSNSAQGFYSVEKDDETGAYVVSGNAYTTSTGKLAVAELTFAENASSAGNTISTSTKDYDFSNATIVDTTEVGNEIDSISLLKDAIKAGEVKVSVIYNEENNTIAYAYVTAYSSFN